jgi:FMN-dependent oxidoreductase (nitrilotriacetate monooxygenase family)
MAETGGMALTRDRGTMTPLLLGIFQLLGPNGTIGASWRHPENTSTDFLTLSHWTKLARKLDAAGFDFLFFADGYGYPMLNGELLDSAVRDGINMPLADPLPLLPALAAVTERLAFVATASTTVERPQALARRFATLDHFTGGRVGWNIVTGASQASSAQLFGEAMIPHDERYERAEDYLELCLKLWEDSWDDGALRADKEAGVFADPSGVHQIVHEGPWYSAKGVLNVPPSPQRTPVLFQAGTSGRGKDYAARHAEAVFLAGGDPDHVAANIRDIRGRAEEFGRSPDSIRFLVGAMVVAGESRADAERKRAEMLALSTVEQAAAMYAFATGLDLLGMDQDAPLGGVRTEQGQSSVDRYAGPARPTVREILEDYRRNGINGTVFVGDAIGVADAMEEFVARTGADGFLLQPHVTPGTYDDLIEIVLPELRTRGLVGPEPVGATLREHLFGEGHSRLPADHPRSARTPVA